MLTLQRRVWMGRIGSQQIYLCGENNVSPTSFRIVNMVLAPHLLDGTHPLIWITTLVLHYCCPTAFQINHNSTLSVALGATDADSSCVTDIDTPIDFHIELVDVDGNMAVLPLSHFGILYPQSTFAYELLKFPVPNENRSEIVLDTFILPLAAFTEMSEALDPSAIRAISLVFDETGCGAVVIDNLGFRS